MFNSIFATGIGGSLSFTPLTALYCTIASLLMGFVIAYITTRDGASTRHYAATIAVLPVIVQAVIMTVNGNLGYSIAVLGAFGLIRFRSAQGSAREIGTIFLAMTVGLMNAIGLIGYAAALTVIVLGFMTLLEKLHLGDNISQRRSLRITIPEDLDYTAVFDDIFAEFTADVTLNKVKTTNLGSLFELSYDITLKRNTNEKEFLDAIRSRNGNLTVVCARSGRDSGEL